MILDDAQVIVEQLAAILRPRCQRIEIAGSVRRQKEDVGDIEIVATPMMGRSSGLWANFEINLLEDYEFLSSLGRLIKNGTKYKQIALYQGVNLDLFIVLPGAQDWGVIYTIRTGPAEFSHWCVTRRREGGGLPSNCRVSDGRVWRGNEHVPLPEEIDFLNFLGLGWVEPKDRQPGWRKA